jgi:hypothetical protein
MLLNGVDGPVFSLRRSTSMNSASGSFGAVGNMRSVFLRFRAGEGGGGDGGGGSSRGGGSNNSGGRRLGWACGSGNGSGGKVASLPSASPGNGGYESNAAIAMRTIVRTLKSALCSVQPRSKCSRWRMRSTVSLGSDAWHSPPPCGKSLAWGKEKEKLI